MGRLVIYDPGPRVRRVYDALRKRIVSGESRPGTRLPSHVELATAYGVAPLTVRHALSRLGEEGLISREQGRGTFVRERTAPAILVVDDEESMRTVLCEHVTDAGFRCIPAASPAEGLAALERDPAIALVLSDVRMPDRVAGIRFVRAVRRLRPDLPLAAVTGFPDDLACVHGTPECPVLVVPKPFWIEQIEEVFRLAIPHAQPSEMEYKSSERPNHG